MCYETNQYNQLIKRYRKRIRAKIVELKQACEAAGYRCDEPFEMNGDDYRDTFVIFSDNDDRSDNPDNGN